MARTAAANCSTISTATPCRAISATCSYSRLTTSGASPMESSSSSSTAGSVARPRARASICCSPPDNVPAACAARLARAGNRANAISSMCSRLCPVNVIIRRLSRTDRLGNTPRPSGIRQTPARARSRGAAPVTSRPPSRSRPDRTGWTPAATRSVVVLPAPFGPSRATTWPAATLRSTPCRTEIPSYPARTSRSSSTVFIDAPPARYSCVPQVGRLYGRVVADHGGRAGRDDLAQVEHVYLVAHVHDQPHVVLDEQDRRALGGQRPQQRREPRGLGAVLPGRGLVEQEEHRRHGQRPAHLHQAAEPGGQRVHGSVGDPGQVQPGEDLGDGGPGPAPLRAQFRGDQQVVAYGQPAEEFEPLERPGQPVPGPPG